MKRLLVTGSTGNLGRALMEEGMARGWEVVGLSRQVVPFRGAIVEAKVDLTKPQEVARALLSQRRPFDLVVAAHGVQQPMPWADLMPSTWDAILAGNLSSAAYLALSLVQLRRLREGAMILFCSSIQATTPRPGRAAYAAAKAGLEGLTRALAVELAPHVRVIALRLGHLTTPMRGIRFDPEEEAALKRRAPLGWIEPPVAAKLAFALYEQPNLSGVVIQVDGLQSLQVWG